METGTIILLVILGVLAILVIWFIAAYNGFVGLKNAVEEAFSTMDVYMKKRYDLIPNLVETVNQRCGSFGDQRIRGGGIHLADFFNEEFFLLT